MGQLKIENKGRFAFIDVTHIPDQQYKQLVICKSYLASMTSILEHLHPDFSGKILIDNLFRVGNSSNRFIEAYVENGIPIWESFVVVSPHRQDVLRKLSNDIIRQDPDGMEAGVMTSHQKKLLSKGISI